MIAAGTHRVSTRCALVLFALLATALATPAGAARVARTARGAPVRWPASEVRLVPVSPSPATGVSPEELFGALHDAAQAWNDGLRGCGAPVLKVQPVAPRWLKVAQDGQSAVLLRAGHWCPDDHADPTQCHESWRAGIAHLYQRPGQDPVSTEGLLAEADVEVNAVHFRWSREGSRPGTSSLRALFTHELGHVLGLDHGCDPEATKAEARACRFPGFEHAAMYPNPIEATRPQVWSPSADEVQTLCARYGGLPREPPSSLPGALAVGLLAARGLSRKRSAP